MTTVPWSQVLDAAKVAAGLLPPPLNVVSTLALAIAQGFVDAGCTVEGCDADIELRPPRAPDLRGRALADEIELDRIATGTDKASVRARLDRDDADEVLVRRTPESPDADEVYGDG